MTDSPLTFDLPPSLKLEECQELHHFLQSASGRAVTLNCAAVTRMGGLAAQMLTMAVTCWRADQVDFAFEAVGEDLRADLQSLGLDHILSSFEAAI